MFFVGLLVMYWYLMLFIEWGLLMYIIFLLFLICIRLGLGGNVLDELLGFI